MGFGFCSPRAVASVLAVVSRQASSDLIPSPLDGPPDDSPIPLREWALGSARERFDVWLSNKTSFEPFVDDDAGVRGYLSNRSYHCGSGAQTAITGGVPEMFLEYHVDGARAVDVFNVLLECGSPWTSGRGIARSSCELLKVPIEVNMEKQAQGIRAVYTRPKQYYPMLRESTSWRVTSANFTAQEFYYIETNNENEELFDVYPRNPQKVEQDMCFYGLRVRADGDRVHVTQTSLYNPNYNFWLPREHYLHGGFKECVDWVGELRRRSQFQNSKNFNASFVDLPAYMLELKSCSRYDNAPNTDYRAALLARADEELRRTNLVELPPRRLPGGEMLNLSQRLHLCGGRDITAELTPVWHGKVLLQDAEPVEVFTTIASKLQETSWNSYLTSIGTFNTTAAWTRGLRSQYAFGGALALKFDRTINEWQVARHDDVNNTYLVATRSDLTNMTEFENKPDHRRGFSLVPRACNCLSAFEASEGPDPNTTLLQFSIHINPNSNAEDEAIWDMVGPKFIETLIRGIATVSSGIHRLRDGRGELPKPWPPFDDGVLAILVPPPPNGRNPDATLSELIAAPMEQKREIFLKLDITAALNTTLRNGGLQAFMQVSAEMIEILWWANGECSTPTWIPHNRWCQTLSDTFQAGIARDRIQLQQQGWALGFVQQQLVATVCTPAPEPIPTDLSSGLNEFIFIGVAALLMLAVFLCVRQSLARRRKMLAEVHLVSEGLEEARGAERTGRMFVAGLFGSRSFVNSSAVNSIAVGDPQHAGTLTSSLGTGPILSPSPSVKGR